MNTQADIESGNRKPTRRVIGDQYGFCILLANVCPGCLGEKNVYRKTCNDCKTKFPKNHSWYNKEQSAQVSDTTMPNKEQNAG